MSKYLSRKFVVTIMIMIAGPAVPYAYKHMGVSDTVTLAVLALIGGIGAAYGIVNVAQDKIGKGE